jgi:hypothetical protein
MYDSPKKRSHPGTAPEERLNKVSHFLYHYDTNRKIPLYAAIRRSREPKKKHISIVKSFINQPTKCPGENVLKDTALLV